MADQGRAACLQERIAEAERRDHRKLGAEMDLFSFPDEIGSGLAVFHPKGGIIRYEIEENLRKHLLRNGYDLVNSPHITKKDLFMTSGHLQTYADGMFPPMHLDEVVDEEGNVTRQGQDYYLKPMNCPFHNLIFRSRGRSYRELPLRLAEFGTVYRYEKSGTLSGLTRVRGLTQDDAHIYVAQDQVKDELTTNLNLVLDLLRDYGLNDFYLELSTNEVGNPKFLGEPEQWTTAIGTLREVAIESGLELVADPGGAAFYGPKISVQARDAIGRTWQMSTIQLDFNQPDRFELEYTGPDGQKHRPVMIHRALLGSVERFFAILLEHYAGDFPLWLAPSQVVGVPVAEQYGDYLDNVIAQLREAGVRADVDHSDDRMQKKIRNHTTAKVPVILIGREQDRAAGTVSFRFPRRDAGERRPGGGCGTSDQRRHRLARARAEGRGPGVTEGERPLEDAGRLAGVPDEFQRLWTPHRMAYIQAGPEPLREECPFCEAPKFPDEERLVVARGETAYVLLNLFPYNSGHLLVCPYRHIATYDQATPAEVAEIGALTQTAMRVLREVSRCDGFNIGMNQGAVAGAGVDAHLHQHVVPRWTSDANFFPIIAKTKALPQLLGEVREAVANAWPASEPAAE